MSFGKVAAELLTDPVELHKLAQSSPYDESDEARQAARRRNALLLTLGGLTAAGVGGYYGWKNRKALQAGMRKALGTEAPKPVGQRVQEQVANDPAVLTEAGLGAAWAASKHPGLNKYLPNMPFTTGTGAPQIGGLGQYAGLVSSPDKVPELGAGAERARRTAVDAAGGSASDLNRVLSEAQRGERSTLRTLIHDPEIRQGDPRLKDLRIGGDRKGLGAALRKYTGFDKATEGIRDVRNLSRLEKGLSELISLRDADPSKLTPTDQIRRHWAMSRLNDMKQQFADRKFDVDQLRNSIAQYRNANVPIRPGAAWRTGGRLVAPLALGTFSLPLAEKALSLAE